MPNWLFLLTLDIFGPIYAGKQEFSFLGDFDDLRGVGIALIGKLDMFYEKCKFIKIKCKIDARKVNYIV